MLDNFLPLRCLYKTTEWPTTMRQHIRLPDSPIPITVEKPSTSLKDRRSLTDLTVTCESKSEWGKPTFQPRGLIPIRRKPITKDRNNDIKIGDHKRRKFWTLSLIRFSPAFFLDGRIAGNFETASVLLVWRTFSVTNTRGCTVGTPLLTALLNKLEIKLYCTYCAY